MPAPSISRRTLFAGLGATSLASVMLPTSQARARGAYRVSGWGSLELLDADDRPFRLGEAETPFTLVKLWASWCAGCRAELDLLPSIAPSLGGVERVGLVVVSHPQDWAHDRAILQDRVPALRRARPSPGNSRLAVQADLLADDGWYYVPRSLLWSRREEAVVWSHVGRLDWSDARTLDGIRRLTA